MHAAQSDAEQSQYVSYLTSQQKIKYTVHMISQFLRIREKSADIEKSLIEIEFGQGKKYKGNETNVSKDYFTIIRIDL